MHNYENVIDDLSVILERPESKGYSNSVTFDKIYLP